MGTTITAAQIQAVVAMNSGQAQGTPTPDNGAFGQLLMEMLGNGTGSGQESLLEALFGAESDGQEQPENPWNNAAALQMAAAGFLTPDMYLNLFGEENANMLQGGALSALNSAAMAAQQGTPLADLLNSLGVNTLPANSLTGDANSALNFSAMGTAEQTEQALGDTSVVSMTAESGQSSGESDSLLSGMEQFRRSVSEAQKALAVDKDKKDIVNPDIEALQQKADSTRIDVASLKLGTAENLPSKEDVTAQMKQNILKNLADGKDEFIVKLKPESLGEITVKMQEKDGKISLSIITANPQTAKLLNETAEALRNTLRPLQAEIREIIPRPEQANASQQSNWLGGSFEGFQRQQFAQQQHSSSHSSSFASAVEADGELLAEPEMETVGLNAYI